MPGVAVGETALSILSAPRLESGEFSPDAFEADASSSQFFLTSLINDVAAIPNSVLLVLDDLHVISEPMVDQGTTFLLDNLPPQMHLVLASRSDPPWPFALMRARGEMLEVFVYRVIEPGGIGA